MGLGLEARIEYLIPASTPTPKPSFSINEINKHMKEEKLESMRHSLSHILAQAVLELYPDTKLAIGPAIDTGFYYDFDTEHTFSPEDLPKIEQKMQEIIKEDQKFEQFDKDIDEAIAEFEKVGDIYKLEMAKELKQEGEKTVSFYKNIDKQGESRFVDMCAGPHVKATGKVGAFKLDKVAGAYWKGDEKNKMLQRIYGLAFSKQKELDDYLKMREEAEKRDHKKLGRELDLFSLHEEGPGFPFFHPKGMVLWHTLLDYWYEVHKKWNYKEVKTPILLREKLWHQSGHWDHYKEDMYFTKIDDDGYALKPMNCPGGILIYNSTMHSYRDLPLRVGEIGLVHRNEMSGVLNGLLRVRAFHQDDAHIYCTPDQVKDEIKGVMKLIDEIYATFGLNYMIEFSTRPEKSIGSDEVWENSERIIKEVLEEMKAKYELNEGDGAFYGPKIDYHIKDSLGRTWQCGTIQLDFSFPEKFDMFYIEKDGQKHKPVMLHRTAYGAIERFIGILIEHFAGAFPVWLAPVQVKVVAVSEKHIEPVQALAKRLEDAGLRVETDISDETVANKIRKAELEKVPYMLVFGDKELENKKLNVRRRGLEKTFEKNEEEFVEMVREEVEKKKMD